MRSITKVEGGTLYIPYTHEDTEIFERYRSEADNAQGELEGQLIHVAIDAARITLESLRFFSRNVGSDLQFFFEESVEPEVKH